MTVNTWLQVGLALLVGLALGWLYFGGLWATVQRVLTAASTRRTVTLLIVSYVGRLALALAAFYWLATLSLAALLVGVAAFSLVALLMGAAKARAGA